MDDILIRLSQSLKDADDREFGGASFNADELYDLLDDTPVYEMQNTVPVTKQQLLAIAYYLGQWFSANDDSRAGLDG